MKRQIVRTGTAYEAKESFARAVAVGDWVYVSLCAGVNYETMEIPDTVEGQTNYALDNVTRALAAVGCTLQDVVRRMVIVPNTEHAAEVMAIVGERFRGASPTHVVLCSPLGLSELLVEIEVTAYRGIGSAETEDIKI